MHIKRNVVAKQQNYTGDQCRLADSPTAFQGWAADFQIGDRSWCDGSSQFQSCLGRCLHDGPHVSQHHLDITETTHYLITYTVSQMKWSHKSNPYTYNVTQEKRIRFWPHQFLSVRNGRSRVGNWLLKFNCLAVTLIGYLAGVVLLLFLVLLLEEYRVVAVNYILVLLNFYTWEPILYVSLKLTQFVLNK